LDNWYYLLIGVISVLQLNADSDCLNELNELIELNAPNDSIRDTFFSNREKASCFPKNIFTGPFKNNSSFPTDGDTAARHRVQ